MKTSTSAFDNLRIEKRAIFQKNVTKSLNLFHDLEALAYPEGDGTRVGAGVGVIE